jgi:trans-2,3-dihydro-3-hydroxyanthranilate isomerase
MPRSLTYFTTDVFTSHAFGGNPLAVVIDEHGLAPDVMQRIAAEFNYSETIFLSPPAQQENSARARIFTPGHEIPFAGHPNIGGAFTAGWMGMLFGKKIGEILRFEEDAGLVEVQIFRDDGVVTGARLTAPQPLSIGAEIDPGIIAECASLSVADFKPGAVVASVGLRFIFAELHEDQALVAARIGYDAFIRHMPVGDSISLALFYRDAAHLHLRMFSPLDGVGEDPATGSANAALAALLASRDPEPDGIFKFTIAQGAEMRRPSQLYADVEKRNAEIIRVRIGGSCVAMMTGQINLPD